MREIEAEASKWVVRRGASWDADAEGELAAWCAANPAHREAHERILKLSGALERARAIGASSVIVTRLRVAARKRRGRRRLLAVATVALAALGPLSVNTLFDLSPKTAPVAAHPIESFRRLADGSIVELRTGAQIAVNFDQDARHVELVRGEALFRVEHDPARPFLVRAGGVKVRAIGTAFQVSRNEATVEVLVTEGIVGVDNARSDDAPSAAAVAAQTVLAAGQSVAVALAGPGARASVPKVVNVAPDEIKSRLSWRMPHLQFDGIALKDAVARMNQINRVQIIIPDRSIEDLRVSGTFHPGEPETFSRLLAVTFDLVAEPRSAGEILLSRKDAGKTADKR